MKGKTIWLLAAFLLVFSLHLAYTLQSSSNTSSKWVQVEDSDGLSTYMEKGEYFIGISYGLAISFAVYALLKYAGNQKKRVTGLFSGLTLTSLIYFGACFLSGCCGSPMIAVYVSLLGPSFQGAGKPITLALTAVSVSAGYYILERKETKCGCKNVCKKR
jgi:hypothetical protein